MLTWNRSPSLSKSTRNPQVSAGHPNSEGNERPETLGDDESGDKA
jgi:hypothetical protein